MKKLIKVFAKIRDFVEETLPMLAFLVMFLAFVYGICARYFMNKPSSEAMELQTICFVLVVLLSVAPASRFEDHVTFDLVYNIFPKPVQTAMRAIGYILIAIFCAWLIPGSIEYLGKLTVGTPLLKLPRKVLFAPYVLMLAQAVVLYASRAISDIHALINKTYDQTYNVEKKGDLI